MAAPGRPAAGNAHAPARAKSISLDSRASISFVVAIWRPATSLRIRGRSRISRVTSSTVTAPMPAFQGFGEELAFRHHRIADKAVLDGVIDRHSSRHAPAWRNDARGGEPPPARGAPGRSAARPIPFVALPS